MSRALPWIHTHGSGGPRLRGGSKVPGRIRSPSRGGLVVPARAHGFDPCWLHLMRWSLALCAECSSAGATGRMCWPVLLSSGMDMDGLFALGNGGRGAGALMPRCEGGRDACQTADMSSGSSAKDR